MPENRVVTTTSPAPGRGVGISLIRTQRGAVWNSALAGTPASPLAGASPSGVGRPDRRTSNLKWRIPCDRPACQPRGVGVVGQCSLELQAGADLELGEYLAQVVLDGARADEQPGADLRVRQPVAGQPRDLGLLRGQLLVHGHGGPLAGGLTGGPQLALGPLGECLHADRE